MPSGNAGKALPVFCERAGFINRCALAPVSAACPHYCHSEGRKDNSPEVSETPSPKRTLEGGSNLRDRKIVKITSECIEVKGLAGDNPHTKKERLSEPSPDSLFVNASSVQSTT